FTGFSSQQFIDNRIFGARLTIAGPVGASVEVLDLYGRDMRATIMLGIPPGSEVTIVDTDGNGVPNYNDGIGSFILSGFDETSTMTIIGGPIEQGFSEDADFNEGGPQGFNFTLVDNILGLYDDFEQARFGY